MTMFANAVASATLNANLSFFTPGTWLVVGGEGSTYDAKGILTPVRYGVDGPPRFAYKHITGTITFDNTTFGDPASGVVKQGFRYQSAIELATSFAAASTVTAVLTSPSNGISAAFTAASTVTAGLTAPSNTITPVNDRDAALRALAQRITGPVNPKSILLTSDAALFNVNASGTPSPSSIVFTAQALNVSGTITFATVPANVVLTGAGATRSLAYTDMPGNSLTVVASIVSGGQTYTSSLVVTKLFAGVKGDTGTAGDKTAIAYLYQWAGAQPALPAGTATLTWSSGATTAYTGADSAAWTVTVPANPGTVGAKLWVASKSITAAAAATTTDLTFASGAAVSAYAQNGANGATGAPGVKNAVARAYQWSISGAPTTTGSALFTWSTASYDTVPTTNWSKLVPAPPGPGYTLYEATVPLVDSSGATTSSINWTTASIQSISYTGTNGAAGATGATGATGGTGAQGNSARIAYTLVTGFSLATTPATHTVAGTALPTLGTWGETVAWTNQPGVPAAGQSVFQSDGLFYPGTNQTIWNVPYLSALKVGNLSAISANTGALTVTGTITAGGGKFTVDDVGNVVAKAISIQAADGTVMLSSGGALATAYAAAGTLNSAVNISSSGILSGAGGGTVTIGGLGYSGALDATKNTGAFATLAGQLTSANINTYMAAAAIDGATYIRNITTVSLAAGAVTTEKLTIGTRGQVANLVKNSDFTEFTGTNGGMGTGANGIASLKNWNQQVTATTYAIGRNFDLGRIWNVGLGGAWLFSDAAVDKGELTRIVMIQQTVQILASEPYELSCYVSAHRCVANMDMIFLKADGSQCAVGADSPGARVDGGAGAAGGGSGIPSMVRLWERTVSPADAAQAVIRIWKEMTNSVSGSNDSYLFINRVLMCLSPSDANVNNKTEWTEGGITTIAGGGITTRSIKTDQIEVGSVSKNVSTIIANTILNGTGETNRVVCTLQIFNVSAGSTLNIDLAAVVGYSNSGATAPDAVSLVMRVDGVASTDISAYTGRPTSGTGNINLAGGGNMFIANMSAGTHTLEILASYSAPSGQTATLSLRPRILEVKV